MAMTSLICAGKLGSSDQNLSEKGKATDFHETPISGHLLQTVILGSKDMETREKTVMIF